MVLLNSANEARKKCDQPRLKAWGLDGCKGLLTLLWSVETNVELLHAIVDEGDLVVRHEAVCGDCSTETSDDE